jgi:prevent-host-death family protein
MAERKGDAVLDITTADLRKHLGEVFYRVQYGGESYVVKRKGKEIGAIVPVRVARALQARRDEARGALAAFLEQHTDLNADLTDEEVMDVALEAQEEARAKERKPKTKTRRR